MGNRRTDLGVACDEQDVCFDVKKAKEVSSPDKKKKIGLLIRVVPPGKRHRSLGDRGCMSFFYATTSIQPIASIKINKKFKGESSYGK